MTDGEQDTMQEPEPITADNNFPKTSLPTSTFNYIDSMYTHT